MSAALLHTDACTNRRTYGDAYCVSFFAASMASIACPRYALGCLLTAKCTCLARTYIKFACGAMMERMVVGTGIIYNGNLGSHFHFFRLGCKAYFTFAQDRCHIFILLAHDDSWLSTLSQLVLPVYTGYIYIFTNSESQTSEIQNHKIHELMWREV